MLGSISQSGLNDNPGTPTTTVFHFPVPGQMSPEAESSHIPGGAVFERMIHLPTIPFRQDIRRVYFSALF